MPEQLRWPGVAHTERKVVLVTRQTRFDELLVRHQTLFQARYFVERVGGDFGDYQAEHEAYAQAKTSVLALLGNHVCYQAVDRTR